MRTQKTAVGRRNKEAVLRKICYMLERRLKKITLVSHLVRHPSVNMCTGVYYTGTVVYTGTSTGEH